MEKPSRKKAASPQVSSWKNAVRHALGIAALLALMVLISACSYRYYLGMHGPSIKKYPDVHANITGDSTCLMCHAPGSSMSAPKTTHPGFKGCLKCHNDDIRPPAAKAHAKKPKATEN